MSDYSQGRKDATAAPAAATGGFGQPATTGFGQSTTNTFGQPAAASTSTFGAPKPAGGLFGSTTGTTGFGSTPTTGFGQTQNTGGGLFGQQNQSSPFGGQQQNQQTGGLFGQPQQNQNTTGGLFGATSSSPFGTNQQNQPATTSTFGGFGAPKPAFGATNTTSGFGTPTNTFGQQNQPAVPSSSTFTFGAQPSQQQPQTTGGLFGGGGAFGANNTQNTNTGTSLFGAQNQQNQQNQPATGGLFGSTAPKPGGLFGNTNTNTTGTGGFTFGQNNQTQPATGGLFGNTNTQTTGTTGGLFGQQPQQQNQTGATGGLFGNTNNTGSLFGAKPATTTGSLFGSTPQTTQQPAQTGSLFGNTGTQTGGLFGGGASTFGQQNQQQNQQKPAGSLFGGGSFFGQQQQAQPATQPSGGLFGGLGQSQPASTSLFGSTAPATQQSTLGGSMFGGGLGQSTMSQNQPQQMLTASIDQNPYGRSDLFNYTGQKLDIGSSVKKPALPPLTSSQFRVTPSKSQLNKLRGFSSTSMSSPRSLHLGLSSPAPSAFVNAPGSTDRYRGLTDSPLTPNAFVPRPSIKKLTVNPRSGPVSGEDRLESVLGKSALKSTTNSPQIGSAVASSSRQTPGTPSHLLGNTANGTSSPAMRTAMNESLRRSGSEPQPKKGEYWCRPRLDKLRQMGSKQLRSIQNFSAGRKGYGEVSFDEPVDMTNVDLADLLGGVIVFGDMNIAVYPDDYPDKPGVGEGLNRAATVSLENCFHPDKATKQPITDPSDPRFVKHVQRVKKIPNTEFVSFTDDGTWTFKVEHFSRYGIDDADSDEDEATPRRAQDNTATHEGDVTETEDGTDSEDDDYLPPTRGLRDESSNESQTSFEEDEASVAETEKSQSPRIDPRRSPRTPHSPRGTPSPPPFWNPDLKDKLGAEGMKKMREMQASFFNQPGPRGLVEKQLEAEAVIRAKRMFRAEPDFERAGEGQEALDVQVVRVSIDPLSKETANATKRSSFGETTKPDQLRRPRKYARVELEKSSDANNEGVKADAGLALGRSFRCSWGPNGELVHFGKICRPTTTL